MTEVVVNGSYNVYVEREGGSSGCRTVYSKGRRPSFSTPRASLSLLSSLTPCPARAARRLVKPLALRFVRHRVQAPAVGDTFSSCFPRVFVQTRAAAVGTRTLDVGITRPPLTPF
jgi:hypothetical protein